MKLDPNSYAFPQPGVGGDNNYLGDAAYWNGQPGLSTREYAYLLAWQANLIATAMKAAVNPDVAVRALFGEPEPLRHDWALHTRSSMQYGAVETVAVCKACKLRVGEEEVNGINRAIAQGEREPCPGVKP